MLKSAGLMSKIEKQFESAASILNTADSLTLTQENPFVPLAFDVGNIVKHGSCVSYLYEAFHFALF